MAERITGLDPTSGPLPEPSGRVAARPASLDGAVVGLVANGLGEAEAFLDALYDELTNVHRVAGAIAVLKPSVSVPPEPDDWQRLTEGATVAITGFGG
jgi:hypothetical protein